MRVLRNTLLSRRFDCDGMQLGVHGRRRQAISNDSAEPLFGRTPDDDDAMTTMYKRAFIDFHRL